jgi:hypothetical protein
VGVSAPFFSGDGGNLSNINGANIVGGYGNSNVSDYLASGINAGGYSTSGGVESSAYVLSYGTGAESSVRLSDGVSNSYVLGVGSAYNTWGGANSLNLITYDPGNICLYVNAAPAAKFTPTNLYIYDIASAPSASTVLGYSDKTHEVAYASTLALTGNISAHVMTQTRIEPRVTAVDPAPSILLPLSDGSDQWDILNASGAVTVTADSGVPFHGQKWTWRFYSSTACTLTWDAQYRPFGVTLPTSPAVNTGVYVGMIYNAIDAAWDVVSVATQSTPNPVSASAS